MLELTKDNFEEEVLKGEGLILVDFYSDGCEPCKALMPDVHELEKDYVGKVKFSSLNTTQARRMAISQKVLGLPTITLYKNGEKVGEVTKEDANIANIKSMIQKAL